MTQARAFIGHSFTKDDATIVSIFLKYFEQVSALHPTFTWLHAESAEPLELAQKVLAQADGCNVFIGICTIKEGAIKPSDLRTTWLDSAVKKLRESEIEWKTSDWVIQEIGLAVGRGMKIILLLEEGCRRPGGLQGNVEFIPFTRTNPEASFGKLLEMIRAVAPVPMLGEQGTEGPPAEVTESPPASPTDDDVPGQDWDRDRFEHAYIMAIFTRDDDRAKLINESYQLRAQISAEERAEWLAFTELWSIKWGAKGSIDQIQSALKSFPGNSKIICNLAEALSKFGDHNKSALTYLEGATRVDEVESFRLRGYGALEYARDSDFDKAFEILDELRASYKADQESSILYIISEIGSIMKDNDLQANAMERISLMRPDDVDNRFSLAYKYSELDYNEVSLHHYLQIPVGKRNPTTWNNLGVAYQNFSAPSKSVDAYRRSAESGETLAMSNIAYKFMGAGFLTEASSQIDLALKQSDPHRNVGEAMSRIKDIPDEETKVIDEAIEKAKSRLAILRQLSDGIVKPNVRTLPAFWTSPDCTLQVSIEGLKFRAEGEYEVESKNLFSATAISTKNQYKLTFEGKIVGTRVIGEMQRRHIGGALGATSLLGLGSSETKHKFAMVIIPEENKIKVIEQFSSNFPKEYHLTPLPS